MAKTPSTQIGTKTDLFMKELKALAKTMPRGPGNETAILRSIAVHSDDPAAVLIYLTGLAES